MFLKLKIFIWIITLFLIGIVNAPAQNKQSNSSVLVPDFQETPEIKWVFKTNSTIFSSPVASGSMVYIGGVDSLLHAIDVSSGKERWRIISYQFTIRQPELLIIK